MNARLISTVLVIQFTLSASPGMAQGPGRVFVLVVDDVRFLPSEAESSGRLIAVLRDEVLGESDTFGVVSTGRSAVVEDLRSAGDRAKLNDVIRRVLAQPSSAAAQADAAQLRYHAHVALGTAVDVARNLARVKNPQKHLLFFSSAATSAAFLGAAVGEQDAKAPNAGAAAAPTGQIAAADLVRQVSEIAAAARQSGVTISVLNPNDPASGDLLRRLK